MAPRIFTRWRRPCWRFPDLDAVGAAGAYYALNSGRWVRRHVETVELLDDVTARRRLTVDIQLPDDPQATVERHGDNAVFFVPVTFIAKSFSGAFIDLRDESGGALPLLPSGDNERISGLALQHAAQTLRGDGRALEPQLAALLQRVASGDPKDGVVAAAGVLYLVRERGRLPTNHEAWPRFERLLTDLSVNAAVWVPLRGCLGERRIVKFAYTVSWSDLAEGTPRVSATRQATRLALITRRGERTTPLLVLSRAWRGLATRMGWLPFELEILRPELRDGASYHLQLQAPPGMETRNIRSDAVVTGDRGRRIIPKRTIHSSMAALAFAPGALRERGRAVVALRVPAAGFITLSVTASFLIAAMLWAYAETYHRAATQREVAAAVLVIVPALLAVLAVRPGEHALAAKMLGGVRMSVLGSGVVASAAAAAFAGVRPDAWQLHEALGIYAWIGLVPFALLLVSYGCAGHASARASRWVRRTYWSPLVGAGLYAAAVAGVLAATGRAETLLAEDTTVAAIALAVSAAGGALVIVATLSRAAAEPVRLLVTLWTLSVVLLVAAGALALAREDPRTAAQTLREYGPAAAVIAAAFAVAAITTWRNAR